MEKKSDKFTKIWFETTMDGFWSKDLKDFPFVSESEVTDEFLLHRRSKADKRVDENNKKNAKCVKAIKFFKDGHV